MQSEWYIAVGFVFLGIALLEDLFIISLQIKQLRVSPKLHNLKSLLLLAFIFIFLASLPLEAVYANTLWFHRNYLPIIEIAVIGNSIAKTLFAAVFIKIYKS